MYDLILCIFFSILLIAFIFEKNNTYGSTVLLTFDENHTDLAKDVTEIFRNKQPKTGVVSLQEHEKSVYNHGEQFINDCFSQV